MVPTTRSCLPDTPKAWLPRIEEDPHDQRGQHVSCLRRISSHPVHAIAQLTLSLLEKLVQPRLEAPNATGEIAIDVRQTLRT